jgi:S1-C subfamily serine protease
MALVIRLPTLIWIICFGLFGMPAAHALDPSELFEKLSPSVWVVVVSDRNGIRMGSGSGVVIGSERLITNCHVLRRASSIVVRRDNTGHAARLEHADIERDLCTLTVKNMSAPAVAIAPLSTAKVGAKIITIGAPRGLELTLSDGLISSLRKDKNDAIESIQISAPISPGSSGGGLFNANGELLGIPTWGLTNSQNLNFAVPAEWIKDIAARSEALIAKEKEKKELAIQQAAKQSLGGSLVKQIVGVELISLVKKSMKLSEGDMQYMEGSANIDVAVTVNRGIELIPTKWNANGRFSFKEANDEICITAAYPPSIALSSTWRSFVNCYLVYEYEASKFALREKNSQSNAFILK